MKKVYVDEILKSKDRAEPGPATYNRHPGFGGEAKESGVARYSMRPKNDPFIQHLGKQKKLPGPGNYHNTVDMAGKQPASST